MTATLGEFWDQVHWPYRLKGPETTRDVNGHRFELWIRPTLGDKTWAQLMDPRTLNAWMEGLCTATMKARGRETESLSPAYIHSIKATLSAAITHAITYALLPSSPMVFLRMSLPTMGPSAQCKARERHWKLDEARRFILDDLLPLAKRVEVCATILMACRGGEVRASLWSDYHLDAVPPFVSISKSSKAKRKIGTTKTKVERDVPLHAELVTVLRMYSAHLGRPTGLVFPRAVQGQPGVGWKALCAAANVSVIVFHGLRHTGGQLLSDAGVHETDIGAIMGHKGKSITSHYASPQVPRLAKAMAMLVLLGEDAARVVPALEEVAPDTQRDVAPMSEPEPPTVRRAA